MWTCTNFHRPVCQISSISNNVQDCTCIAKVWNTTYIYHLPPSPHRLPLPRLFPLHQTLFPRSMMETFQVRAPGVYRRGPCCRTRSLLRPPQLRARKPAGRGDREVNLHVIINMIGLFGSISLWLAYNFCKLLNVPVSQSYYACSTLVQNVHAVYVVSL